jgi:hypothetical protein
MRIIIITAYFRLKHYYYNIHINLHITVGVYITESCQNFIFHIQLIRPLAHLSQSILSKSYVFIKLKISLLFT